MRLFSSSGSPDLALRSRVSQQANLIRSLGPVFHLDPALPSLRTLSGSTILTIADAAGGGLVMAGVNAPTLDTAHLLKGRPAIVLGSTSALRAAAGGITGAAPHTMMALCDFNAAPGSQPDGLMLFGPQTSAAHANSAIGMFTNPYYSGMGSGSDFEPQGRLPAPDSAPHVIQGDYNGLRKTLYLDGAMLCDTALQPSNGNNNFAVTYAVADTSFGLGRFSTSSTSHTSRIRQALWFNYVLSLAQRQQVIAYWTTLFGLSSTAPQVFFDGDSLTFGNNAVHGVSDWPTFALASVSALRSSASKVAIGGTVNWAIAGSRVTDINTRTAISILPVRSARSMVQVYSIDGGTNEILSDGVDAATVIGRLTTGCRAAKAAGFRVMLSTLPPGSSVTGYINSPAFKPIKDGVNAWILGTAKAAGIADGVVDVESTGLTFTPALYGADLIHPNATGYALWAAAATPVLDSLLGS